MMADRSWLVIALAVSCAHQTSEPESAPALSPRAPAPVAPAPIANVGQRPYPHLFEGTVGWALTGKGAAHDCRDLGISRPASGGILLTYHPKPECGAYKVYGIAQTELAFANGRACIVDHGDPKHAGSCSAAGRGVAVSSLADDEVELGPLHIFVTLDACGVALRRANGAGSTDDPSLEFDVFNGDGQGRSPNEPYQTRFENLIATGGTVWVVSQADVGDPCVAAQITRGTGGLVSVTWSYNHNGGREQQIDQLKYDPVCRGVVAFDPVYQTLDANGKVTGETMDGGMSTYALVVAPTNPEQVQINGDAYYSHLACNAAVRARSRAH